MSDLLPYDKWVETQAPQELDDLGRLKQYGDYYKLTTFENGEYDEEVAQEVDRALFDSATRMGLVELDNPEDEEAREAARAQFFSRDPEPRVTSQDLGDLVRYTSSKSPEQAQVIRDFAAMRQVEDAPLEMLAEREEAAAPFMSPDDLRAARKAAVKRGDRPLYFGLHEDGSLDIEVDPNTPASEYTNEKLAQIARSQGIDPRYLPAIKTQVTPVEGLGVSPWELDQLSAARVALSDTSDPDLVEFRDVVVEEVKRGDLAAATRTAETMARASQLGSDFGSKLAQDGVLNYAKEIAAMSGDVEEPLYLSTGEVMLPRGLYVRPDAFEEALDELDITPAQKEMTLRMRSMRMAAQVPRLHKAAVATASREYIDHYEQGKAAGKSDQEVLEEWFGDEDNYEAARVWGMGLGDAVSGIATDIPLSAAALAGSETARKSMARDFERDALRREYAAAFGNDLGITYDLMQIAPDILSDIGISIATGGTATAAVVGAKASARALVKQSLKRSLTAGAATAARNAIKESAERGAMSKALALAGNDVVKGMGAWAKQTAIIAPATFTRQAGATYTSTYGELERRHPDWSPEKIREAAYGHAVTSGSITLGITSAFSALAQAFPKVFGEGVEAWAQGRAPGLTIRQMRAAYKKLALAPSRIPKEMKAYLNLDSFNGFVKSITKEGLKRSWGLAVLRNAASESLEELSDEVINGFNEANFFGEDTDLLTLIKKGSTAAIAGGVFGGVGGLRSAGVRSSISDRQFREVSRGFYGELANNLETSGDTASASALRTLMARAQEQRADVTDTLVQEGEAQRALIEQQEAEAERLEASLPLREQAATGSARAYRRIMETDARIPNRLREKVVMADTFIASFPKDAETLTQKQRAQLAAAKAYRKELMEAINDAKAAQIDPPKSQKRKGGVLRGPQGNVVGVDRGTKGSAFPEAPSPENRDEASRVVSDLDQQIARINSRGSDVTAYQLQLKEELTNQRAAVIADYPDLEVRLPEGENSLATEVSARSARLSTELSKVEKSLEGMRTREWSRPELQSDPEFQARKEILRSTKQYLRRKLASPDPDAVADWKKYPLARIASQVQVGRRGQAIADPNSQTVLDPNADPQGVIEVIERASAEKEEMDTKSVQKIVNQVALSPAEKDSLRSLAPDVMYATELEILRERVSSQVSTAATPPGDGVEPVKVSDKTRAKLDKQLRLAEEGLADLAAAARRNPAVAERPDYRARLTTLRERRRLVQEAIDNGYEAPRPVPAWRKVPLDPLAKSIRKALEGVRLPVYDPTTGRFLDPVLEPEKVMEAFVKADREKSKSDKATDAKRARGVAPTQQELDSLRMEGPLEQFEEEFDILHQMVTEFNPEHETPNDSPNPDRTASIRAKQLAKLLALRQEAEAATGQIPPSHPDVQQAKVQVAQQIEDENPPAPDTLPVRTVQFEDNPNTVVTVQGTTANIVVDGETTQTFEAETAEDAETQAFATLELQGIDVNALSVGEAPVAPQDVDVSAGFVDPTTAVLAGEADIAQPRVVSELEQQAREEYVAAQVEAELNQREASEVLTERERDERKKYSILDDVVPLLSTRPRGNEVAVWFRQPWGVENFDSEKHKIKAPPKQKSKRKKAAALPPIVVNRKTGKPLEPQPEMRRLRDETSTLYDDNGNPQFLSSEDRALFNRLVAEGIRAESRLFMDGTLDLSTTSHHYLLPFLNTLGEEIDKQSYGVTVAAPPDALVQSKPDPRFQSQKTKVKYHYVVSRRGGRDPGVLRSDLVDRREELKARLAELKQERKEGGTDESRELRVYRAAELKLQEAYTALAQSRDPDEVDTHQEYYESFENWRQAHRAHRDAEGTEEADFAKKTLDAATAELNSKEDPRFDRTRTAEEIAYDEAYRELITVEQDLSRGDHRLASVESRIRDIDDVLERIPEDMSATVIWKKVRRYYKDEDGKRRSKMVLEPHTGQGQTLVEFAADAIPMSARQQRKIEELAKGAKRGVRAAASVTKLSRGGTTVNSSIPIVEKTTVDEDGVETTTQEVWYTNDPTQMADAINLGWQVKIPPKFRGADNPLRNPSIEESAEGFVSRVFHPSKYQWVSNPGDLLEFQDPAPYVPGQAGNERRVRYVDALPPVRYRDLPQLGPTPLGTEPDRAESLYWNEFEQSGAEYTDSERIALAERMGVPLNEDGSIPDTVPTHRDRKVRAGSPDQDYIQGAKDYFDGVAGGDRTRVQISNETRASRLARREYRRTIEPLFQALQRLKDLRAAETGAESVVLPEDLAFDVAMLDAKGGPVEVDSRQLGKIIQEAEKEVARLEREAEAARQKIDEADQARAVDVATLTRRRQEIADAIEQHRVTPIAAAPPVTEEDRKYLALAEAAEAGDQEAQAQVEQLFQETAEEAGFTIGPVYRVDPEEFNQFDLERRPEGGSVGPGFYFSGKPNPNIERQGGVTRRFYLRVTKPQKLDSKGEPKGIFGSMSDEALQRRMERGTVDGVVNSRFMEHLYDGLYTVNSPSQIKSAEAIVRDDAGNIIPLSQRFDTGEDVRGSAAAPEAGAQTSVDEYLARREEAAEEIARARTALEDAQKKNRAKSTMDKKRRALRKAREKFQEVEASAPQELKDHVARGVALTQELAEVEAEIRQASTPLAEQERNDYRAALEASGTTESESVKRAAERLDEASRIEVEAEVARGRVLNAQARLDGLVAIQETMEESRARIEDPESGERLAPVDIPGAIERLTNRIRAAEEQAAAKVNEARGIDEKEIADAVGSGLNVTPFMRRLKTLIEKTGGEVEDARDTALLLYTEKLREFGLALQLLERENQGKDPVSWFQTFLKRATPDDREAIMGYIRSRHRSKISKPLSRQEASAFLSEAVPKKEVEEFQRKLEAWAGRRRHPDKLTAKQLGSFFASEIRRPELRVKLEERLDELVRSDVSGDDFYIRNYVEYLLGELVPPEGETSQWVPRPGEKARPPSFLTVLRELDKQYRRKLANDNRVPLQFESIDTAPENEDGIEMAETNQDLADAITEAIQADPWTTEASELSTTDFFVKVANHLDRSPTAQRALRSVADEIGVEDADSLTTTQLWMATHGSLLNNAEVFLEGASPEVKAVIQTLYRAGIRRDMDVGAAEEVIDNIDNGRVAFTRLIVGSGVTSPDPVTNGLSGTDLRTVAVNAIGTTTLTASQKQLFKGITQLLDQRGAWPRVSFLSRPASTYAPYTAAYSGSGARGATIFVNLSKPQGNAGNTLLRGLVQHVVSTVDPDAASIPDIKAITRSFPGTQELTSTDLTPDAPQEGNVLRFAMTDPVIYDTMRRRRPAFPRRLLTSVARALGLDSDVGRRRLEPYLKPVTGQVWGAEPKQRRTPARAASRDVSTRGILDRLAPPGVRVNYSDLHTQPAWVTTSAPDTVNVNLETVDRMVGDLAAGPKEQVLRALLNHEMAHLASLQTLTDADRAEIYQNLTPDELDEVLARTPEGSGYLEVAEEYVRMMVERATHGVDSDEFVRSVLNKPAGLRGVLRSYLQRFLNFLRRLLPSRPNLHTRVHIDRVADTLAGIQRGGIPLQPVQLDDIVGHWSALEELVAEGSERTFFSVPIFSTDQSVSSRLSSLRKHRSMRRELREIANQVEFSSNAVEAVVKDFHRKVQKAMRARGVALTPQLLNDALGSNAPYFTEAQQDTLAAQRASDVDAGMDQEQVEKRDADRQRVLHQAEVSRRVAAQRDAMQQIKAMDPQLAKEVEFFRDQITVKSREVGQIHNGGAFKAVFDDRAEIHLIRSYEFFQSKAWREAAMYAKDDNGIPGYEDVPFNELRSRAIDDIKDWHFRNYGTTIDKRKARNMLVSWLSELAHQKPGVLNINTLTKSNKLFAKKEDIPAGVRALLGEQDAITSAANTSLKLDLYLSKHDAAKKTRQLLLKQGWAYDSPMGKPGTELTPLWTSIQGDPEYESLQGLYAPEEDARLIEDAMSSVVSTRGPAGDELAEIGTNIVKKFFGIPMVAKTLFSVGFFTRNELSNSFYALPMQGVWSGPLSFMGISGKGRRAANLAWGGVGLRRFAAGGEAYTVELLKHGVIHDDVTTGLLNDLYNRPGGMSADITQDMEDLAQGSKPKGRLRRAVQKIMDAQGMSATAKEAVLQGKGGASDLVTVLSGLNQVIDAKAKIQLYEYELNTLRAMRDEIGGTQTDEDLKRQAAAKVHKTMQGHSQVPHSIRLLTGSTAGLIVAPFARFKAEVVRTWKNTLPLAWSEWKEGSQVGSSVLKKRALNRSLSFLFVNSLWSSAVVGLVSAIFDALGGEDDDADDEGPKNGFNVLQGEMGKTIRMGLPRWARNHTIYARTNDDGTLTTFDMTFVNPLSLIHDPFRVFVDRLATDDMDAAMAGVVDTIVHDVIGEGIGPGAAREVVMNTDEYGRNIFQPTDDMVTRARKSLAHYLENALEPAVYSKGAQFIQAIDRKDKASDGDRFYDAKSILAGELIGVRPRDYITEELMKRSARNTKLAIDDARQLLSPIYSRGWMDPEEGREAIRAHREAYVELWSQHVRNAEAWAQILGSDEALMRYGKYMVEAGHSKDRTGKALLDRVTDRYVLSREGFENVHRAADTSGAEKGDVRLPTLVDTFLEAPRFIPLGEEAP